MSRNQKGGLDQYDPEHSEVWPFDTTELDRINWPRKVQARSYTAAAVTAPHPNSRLVSEPAGPLSVLGLGFVFFCFLLQPVYLLRASYFVFNVFPRVAVWEKRGFVGPAKRWAGSPLKCKHYWLAIHFSTGSIHCV